MAEKPMVPVRTEFPDLSGVPSEVLPPAKVTEQTNYHVEKPAEPKNKKKGYFAVALTDLGRYIFEEILIPSSKDLFSGIVKKAVDVWIYGEPQKTVKKEGDPTYVSYNRYYNDRSDSRRDNSSTGRYSRDCEDDPNFLKFWSREEAEDCLENLRSVIRRDGQVSVAFVYEICRQKCDHTSVNYGWYSLTDAAVIPYRDGYRIDFPKVKCISR